MSIHERIWIALVGAFGFFCVNGMVTMLFLIRGVHAKPGSSPPDTWVLEYVAVVMAMHALAIAATIVMRFVKPPVGRVMTKALNIIMLISMFPIGTAIGIYGLWKVDRRPRDVVQTGSPSAPPGQ
jgi:hypothetical protein